jgi:hypothetical protein
LVSAGQGSLYGVAGLGQPHRLWQKSLENEGISHMSDLDFIEEIRIAQFWRKQLGELEYVQRDPEDLRRWYVALETRGPDEIRDYLIERTGRYPAGQVVGIVSKAPHPPREIIDLWLASHDKTHTMPYWVGLAAFVVACMLIGPNMAGCQNLPDRSLFAVTSPPHAVLAPGQAMNAPQTQATSPTNFPAPANTASPMAGSTRAAGQH